MKTETKAKKRRRRDEDEDEAETKMETKKIGGFRISRWMNRNKWFVMWFEKIVMKQKEVFDEDKWEETGGSDDDDDKKTVNIKINITINFKN